MELKVWENCKYRERLWQSNCSWNETGSLQQCACKKCRILNLNCWNVAGQSSAGTKGKEKLKNFSILLQFNNLNVNEMLFSIGLFPLLRFYLVTSLCAALQKLYFLQCKLLYQVGWLWILNKKKNTKPSYCFNSSILMLFVMSFYQKKTRNLILKHNALPL